jgi:hypothetical protein
MVSTFQLTRTVKLCLTHQISPIPQIFEFKSASSADPLPLLVSKELEKEEMRENQSTGGNRPVENNAIEADGSACATLRENGTGCRAEALRKMRTGFEDAHAFREVRILEKPGDSFEDAHPFPRCARKLRTFKRSTVRTRARALGRAELRQAAGKRAGLVSRSRAQAA